jgi:hypothetical protein
MHRLQEIVRLHRLGRGSRSIARELKISPNTERRYRTIFTEAGLLLGDPDALPELAELRAAVDADAATNAKPNTKSVSSIASWRPEIERLYKGGATPKAIYDWLRRERKDDFNGSYPAVKRMSRRLAKEIGPAPQDVVIPIYAPPGEAQVDFGYRRRPRPRPRARSLRPAFAARPAPRRRRARHRAAAAHGLRLRYAPARGHDRRRPRPPATRAGLSLPAPPALRPRRH